MCSSCADDRLIPADFSTPTVAAAAAHQYRHALPADNPRPSARDLAEDGAENRREMKVSSR